MKNFLLYTFLFFSTYCFGQAKGSQLKVSLSDRSTIRITIDGKEYFQQKDIIVVNKINPGCHRLKVFLITTENKRNSGLVYNKSVKIKLGKQTELIINKKNKKARIKYHVLKEQDIDHLNGPDGRHASDPIDKSKWYK